MYGPRGYRCSQCHQNFTTDSDRTRSASQRMYEKLHTFSKKVFWFAQEARLKLILPISVHVNGGGTNEYRKRKGLWWIHDRDRLRITIVYGIRVRLVSYTAAASTTSKIIMVYWLIISIPSIDYIINTSSSWYGVMSLPVQASNGWWAGSHHGRFAECACCVDWCFS